MRFLCRLLLMRALSAELLLPVGLLPGVCPDVLLFLLCETGLPDGLALVFFSVIICAAISSSVFHAAPPTEDIIAKR